MFSFSSAVCRRLVNHRSLRLMYSTFQSKCEPSDKTMFDLNSDPKSSIDYTRPGISFTTKYINELENEQDIQWDDLLQKLKAMKMKNPSTKILQACIRLDKLELGIAYYNYITSKGEKLTSLDLMFFSKLLINRKSEIKKYEELLIKLYYEVKDYMETSYVIRRFILQVFVEIPTCFDDIISTRTFAETRVGNLPVVQKALQLNMIDVAFDYMRDSDFFPSTGVLDNFIDFCIRMAESGKFSNSYIDKLIGICNEKALTLNHENLLIPFQSLVRTLNECQKDYYWSISECMIGEDSICSNCNLALLPKLITNEEFNTLKEHFFHQAFIDKNIFIRSTRIELERFLKFLRNIRPYDVVFDGLNIMYKNKHAGSQIQGRYLKYFLDKGCRVLIIGRYHSKTELMKPSFLSFQKYKNNTDFFFTSDISDDDVFVLYAALHGGPNTCFVTGDYLGSYAALLDEERKCIFHRWQLSHQHVITPEYDVSPALPHCGLPQLTLNTQEKFVWHLSHQDNNKIKINVGIPVNWFCLTAEKKSE